MTLTTEEEIHLQGVPICKGIAIGKPFFFSIEENEIPTFTIATADIGKEIARYMRALHRSREDVRRLQQQLENERILEGAAILDAHLQMMQDPILTTEIEEMIKKTKKNAEYAFQKVIKHYQKKFNSLDDPFFRERFKDLQDISRRVLGYLRESIKFCFAAIPPESIVFAKELTASDTAEVDCSLVKAFVTEMGSQTSHAAILAKARGIPFIVNVDYDKQKISSEHAVIADGRIGTVIINPLPQTLQRYKALSNQLGKQQKKLASSASLKSVTTDGFHIKLSANVETIEEVEQLHAFGGHGIGLFRSENIFLSKETFPSEDEQYKIYRTIVEQMKKLPLVIRTFDIGGDKCFSSQTFNSEGNPFLGCRAIRLLLKEKEVFKAQLRAILRASLYGNVSLMFPMISSLTELIEAKAVIKEVEEELAQNGIKLHKPLRVGCMIEVPSAAIIADLLAQECDFLSIGTNDLVQYSLAVDRGNHALSRIYNPTHPGIIRLIKMVVGEANRYSVPVSLCGEIAADPRFTPLLLGLGIQELSVSARYIPLIKNAIRRTNILKARKLSENVLSLTNAHDILELLTEEYQNSHPEDCTYSC